jgi:acyl carrier protein
MNIEQIELRLREELLEVLGFDSVDEIPPDASLVDELGAESLDFVETLWVIEETFGIVIKTNEILSGQIRETSIQLFEDDKLTQEGTDLLKEQVPHWADRLVTGLTKASIFRLLTVHDLAVIVHGKLGELEPAGQEH